MRRGAAHLRARLRAALTTVRSAEPRQGPQPSIAAFLSFLWPGLGQAYAAEFRMALVFGLPAALLAIIVIVQLVSGAESFAVQLVDPGFAATVLGWTIAVGLWRLFAIGHAFRLATAQARAMRSARTLLAVVTVLVIAMHLFAGYYAWSFYQASSAIFQPNDDLFPAVAGHSSSPAGTGSLAPGATPPPSRPPTNRVTILLTGVDSGHDRNHALTDTLLVVSVDTVDKTAVMLSIPRDIAQFRLYSGGIYQDKINSLMTAAKNAPARFPDGPMGTLTRQIGFIIGVPIDYYALIDLDGFEKMVTLVGGVDVDNPRAIDDPLYDWRDGTWGFRLSAGPHHLDGRTALAYVRSRQGAGDNDFTRARRQQQVLAALRVKLTSPSGLRQLPSLLDVASQTIRTNFPSNRVRDYVGLSRAIGDDQILRYVLGPPYARSPTTPGSTYVLLLDPDRIAKLSIKVFGTDSHYYGLPGSSP
jgi:polyisoprenyl-teichoic acid--peptidoglycan teichoic acid transferase